MGNLYAESRSATWNGARRIQTVQTFIVICTKFHYDSHNTMAHCAEHLRDWRTLCAGNDEDRLACLPGTSPPILCFLLNVLSRVNGKNAQRRFLNFTSPVFE